jgi:phosphoglycerol transferase MdoB-like AlkP superfamily enzyme
MAKVFQGFVRVFAKVNKQKQLKILSSYSFLRFILLLTLIQVIAIEAIQRGSLFSAFCWLSANLHIFVLNYFLTILICLFFISLTGSLRPTVIFSSFILIFLALASLVKKQFLGDPLFPWDFFRIDQAWNLLPQYSGEIRVILTFLGLLVLGLMIVAKILIPKHKVSWLLRSVLLIGIIIIVPILVYYRHTPLGIILKRADIEHIYWVQAENSLKNGFLLGFTMNLENIMVFQPEGYNSVEIGRIVGENTPSVVALSTSSRSQSNIKPNIVLVLNEAFWDPVELPNVTFSKDPIPFFRYLKNNYQSGTMISPVFGGNTANVEFEILTGFSTKYFPQGSIAYQQYIKQPIPSIPSLFKANGYITTAIHPYYDWFYKRDKIFPLLGFENFYSLRDFQKAEIKGEYISDLEVSKMISSEIQNNQGPAFIFAVTMQNHGPYSEKRYSDKEISVKGNLSSQAKGILETYAQGLCDADGSLRMLIDQINQLGEPTAILFLGDHLPYLGKDYLVYKQTGYIEESETKWSVDDNLKMKSVPFVIWSNYGVNVQPEVKMSSQFLGNYLLDLAEVEDNFIFNFTRNFADKLPIYGKNVNMDLDNRSLNPLPNYLQKLEQDYWLIQYDILFGEHYYNDYIYNNVVKE